MIELVINGNVPIHYCNIAANIPDINKHHVTAHMPLKGNSVISESEQLFDVLHRSIV